MGLRQDIEEAIRVHAEWKARFREFLHGKTAFDLSSVGLPNACKLGHWLEREGRVLLAPADYSDIDRLHSEFHRVSGELVQKIKQKDFAGAREDLKTDGAFDQASRAMAVALRKASLHEVPRSVSEGTGAGEARVSPTDAESSAPDAD